MEKIKTDYYKWINSESAISEKVMENGLIYFLVDQLGYVYLDNIKDEESLKNNFKQKFAIINNLSGDKLIEYENQFENIWKNLLHKTDVCSLFNKLKYDNVILEINGIKNTLKYFDFQNIDKNTFEVINQLSVKNNKNEINRFDVVLLINGIPLVHLELKNLSRNFYDAIRQIKTYKENKAISGFLNFIKGL